MEAEKIINMTQFLKIGSSGELRNLRLVSVTWVLWKLGGSVIKIRFFLKMEKMSVAEEKNNVVFTKLLEFFERIIRLVDKSNLLDNYTWTFKKLLIKFPRKAPD